MAANAFARGLETEAAVRNCGLRVKAGVTLQTELAPFAAHQKHAVGAAMRIVATDAAFDLYGGMFVHKGAALLDVTVHASFRSRLVETGHILRAVRIVAIRTLHQPFGNAMVLRQCKLGLNGEMAGKAQRGLRLLQQTVVQPAGFLGQPGHLERSALADSSNFRRGCDPLLPQRGARCGTDCRRCHAPRVRSVRKIPAVCWRCGRSDSVPRFQRRSHEKQRPDGRLKLWRWRHRRHARPGWRRRAPSPDHGSFHNREYNPFSGRPASNGWSSHTPRLLPCDRKRSAPDRQIHWAAPQTRECGKRPKALSGFRVTFEQNYWLGQKIKPRKAICRSNGQQKELCGPIIGTAPFRSKTYDSICDVNF